MSHRHKSNSDKEDGEVDDDDDEIEIIEPYEETVVLSDGSDDFNVEAKLKRGEEESLRKKLRKKAKKEKKEKKREKESKKRSEDKQNSREPPSFRNGHDKTTPDDHIEKRALEEVLRDAKVSKIRGETSGTWHCGLNKTNKRFLQSAIVQTVNHNRREDERHRERSSRKLDQLDRRREKYPDERYDSRGHRYLRNPLSHPRARLRRDYEYDRYQNARRKAERFPPLEPREMKFVKPRDLDDRVLIPGHPKKARVKKITFVCPKEKEEQFLGHDGTDLRMERIRLMLIDKIPTQQFVSPDDPKEKFFLLSGNKVAGLIRKASEDPEPQPKYPVIMQTPSQEWPAAFQTMSMISPMTPTQQVRQLIHSSWPMQQKDAWMIPTSKLVPPLEPPPAPPELPPEEPIPEMTLELYESQGIEESVATEVEETDDVQETPSASDVIDQNFKEDSLSLDENFYSIDVHNALLYQQEIDEDLLQALQTRYFLDHNVDLLDDDYWDSNEEISDCYDEDENAMDEAFVFVKKVSSATFSSVQSAYPPIESNPDTVSTDVTSKATNLSDNVTNNNVDENNSNGAQQNNENIIHETNGIEKTDTNTL